MGTYNENRKSINDTSCIPCKAGWVCRDTGIGKWDNAVADGKVVKCKKGYWCKEGSNRNNQLENKCSEGYACPPGMGVDPSEHEKEPLY